MKDQNETKRSSHTPGRGTRRRTPSDTPQGETSWVASLIAATRLQSVEQAAERARWFAGLDGSQKATDLFRAEVLLRGASHLYVLRDHVGVDRAVIPRLRDVREPIVAFRESLQEAHDRLLPMLGAPRAPVSEEGLLKAIKVGRVRSGFESVSVEASLSQLLVGLRRAVATAGDCERAGMTRTRTLLLLCGSLRQVIEASDYFDVLEGLGLSPELDLDLPDALRAFWRRVGPSGDARVVALAVLAGRRFVRTLTLLRDVSASPDSRDSTLLSLTTALQADARSLARALRGGAMRTLQGALEERALALPPSVVHAPEVLHVCDQMLAVASAVRSYAARIELEAAAFRRLASTSDSFGQLREGLAKHIPRAVRSFGNATSLVARAGGLSIPPQALFQDLALGRDESYTLEQVWMFLRVTQAFTKLAPALSHSDDHWAEPAIAAPVERFRRYFYALGLPTLMASSYPRARVFEEVIAGLSRVGEPTGLKAQHAAAECDRFVTFAQSYLEGVKDINLVESSRHVAAQQLRAYLALG